MGLDASCDFFTVLKIAIQPRRRQRGKGEVEYPVTIVFGTSIASHKDAKEWSLRERLQAHLPYGSVHALRASCAVISYNQGILLVPLCLGC